MLQMTLGIAAGNDIMKSPKRNFEKRIYSTAGRGHLYVKCLPAPDAKYSVRAPGNR